MDYQKLNFYLDRIYNDRSKEAFDDFVQYIEKEQIFKNVLHETLQRIRDTVLYEEDDVKQEILINLWMFLTVNEVIIFSEDGLYNLLMSSANYFEEEYW